MHCSPGWFGLQYCFLSAVKSDVSPRICPFSVTVYFSNLYSASVTVSQAEAGALIEIVTGRMLPSLALPATKEVQGTKRRCSQGGGGQYSCVVVTSTVTGGACTVRGGGVGQGSDVTLAKYGVVNLQITIRTLHIVK